MLATIGSATLSGIDGVPVTVEVHVANGLLWSGYPMRHVAKREIVCALHFLPRVTRGPTDEQR